MHMSFPIVSVTNTDITVLLRTPSGFYKGHRTSRVATNKNTLKSPQRSFFLLENRIFAKYDIQTMRKSATELEFWKYKFEIRK